MVKTILFDLDDTLLDFGKAEASALQHTLKEMNAPADEAVRKRYHEINRQMWKMLERQEITRDELRPRRFEVLFAELGLPCDSAKICEIYERYLGQGHWFMPGAEELLEILAPRYRLCLVSNGNAHVQRNRLKVTGISRYFDGIFISHELGVDKPSRAFFDRCFSAMPEVERETALIVGDSLTSDIQGGKNAGIRTCWYNPEGKCAPEELRPDYECSDLLQLPALLEQI